ncbi:c-type cytochrome [Thiocystis violacea]|uniref:c-type cytochrome n=1 Tax=Thiocystis violacea TaxID=13725 RepID=UPI00190720B0|nr:c-type cytochrome [Thiocystis violacea]MBK1724095.1 cytochrome C [Thiocystis violacea]
MPIRGGTHRFIRPSALALLTTLSAGVQAGQSAEQLAHSGDPARGIEPCANCHQANGGGSEEIGAPRLAAMGAPYLAAQIRHFKNGDRKHSIMTPWAELLTDEETRALSGYYAALPPASNAQVPAGLDPKAGEGLARDGDWDGRRLPACGQCHGPLGIGAAEQFPALAGQPYNYLIGQLAAWTTGKRKGDPLGMMGAINAKISVAESQAAAAFYASLPATRAAAAAVEMRQGQAVPGIAALSAPTPTPESRASRHADQGEVPSGRAPDAARHFEPPARGDMPSDAFGEMVALGEAIFRQTDRHAVSAPYVGNTQVCEGCHLDAGRLADSAPMWAAWVAYPAYRSKNKRVNTLIERIQGCFEYSMNAQASRAGHPPTAESQTMHALLSYFYWLATGAPTGDKTMPGRGYPTLARTDAGFDPARGVAVYGEKCAICHGADGEGGFAGDLMVFPPLWGAQSYNWGAGMHKIDTAAAYIKQNMPLGNVIELTAQDAWDVAAFINSHERPQDPRFDGDLAQTTKQFHNGEFDYYGKRKGADGQLLGTASEGAKRSKP